MPCIKYVDGKQVVMKKNVYGTGVIIDFFLFFFTTDTNRNCVNVRQDDVFSFYLIMVEITLGN